jgi:hypothetical protein
MNENNWFAESMFFVGVHWMEFVSHVKFRQLQTLSCEFEPHSWRGVLDKTLCAKACQ